MDFYEPHSKQVVINDISLRNTCKHECHAFKVIQAQQWEFSNFLNKLLLSHLKIVVIKILI